MIAWSGHYDDDRDVTYDDNSGAPRSCFARVHVLQTQSVVLLSLAGEWVGE